MRETESGTQRQLFAKATIVLRTSSIHPVDETQTVVKEAENRYYLPQCIFASILE